MICRPGFLGEENKHDHRNCIFLKKTFSLLIFSENNIAKLVGDTWGNCFNRLCQLLYNWIWMNMIFKSSHWQMFYKIPFLKNFTKFTWKHLTPSTLLKRDSRTGVFLWILRYFQETLLYKTPLDKCFWWMFLFTFEIWQFHLLCSTTVKKSN